MKAIAAWDFMRFRSLSAEQQAVVEATEKTLKINAVAGSGKTTTLLAYAAHRPQRRILYLAYNRAIADEVRLQALRQKLTHLKVHTLHGLAYHYTKGRTYQLVNELGELTVLDRYCPAEVRQSKKGKLLAWLVKDIVNYYLNSAYTRLDVGLLERYRVAAAPQPAVDELLSAEADRVLPLIRAILSDMKEKRAPAIHDFYLKMFQFMAVTLPYDIILVDEAQDASGVMLSTIGRQRADKVFVGDSFQQIYAFRYAVNSLESLAAPAYWLSRSFRFNDGLAQHISRQVQEAYALIGEPRTLKMRGSATETRWGSRAREDERPLAIISRSNLKLFETCLEYVLGSKGAKPHLYFEGDYRSYAFMNTRIASLIHLRGGRRHKITDPFVGRFASVAEIEAYAEATQNNILLGALQLVKRYGVELFHFDRLVKEQLTERPQADLIFTTTHKAKGQEYESVAMTAEDFTTRQALRQALRQGQPINRAALREEINVYYVAATRAKRSIRLAAF